MKKLCVLFTLALLLISCSSKNSFIATTTTAIELETEVVTPPIASITTKPTKIPTEIDIAETPHSTQVLSLTPKQPIPSSDIKLNSSGFDQVSVIVQASVDKGGLITDLLDERFNLVGRFTTDYIGLGAFTNDRCHLIGIKHKENSFTIYFLDLQGNVIQQKKALLDTIEDELRIYQYTLSPSGGWIAYKIVDDVKMSKQGANIQDVRLLRVNEISPQKVVQLTERGGAKPAELSWSPDGRFLAYTDYDVAGIMQIFIFDPERNQEYQISQFGDEFRENVIQALSWSPDSQEIAFTSIGFQDHGNGGESKIERTNNGVLGIISFPDFQLQWKHINENYKLVESNMSNLRKIFWSRDQQTLLFQFFEEKDGDSTDGVAWYDLTTNHVVHAFLASAISEDVSFIFTFILNDLDQIGIWGDRIFLYDRRTQKTTVLKPSYFLTEGDTFLVSPNGPVSLAQCLNK